MRTIFITGGAQGIGHATATLFHQKGWQVGCFDRDAIRLEALSATLDGLHTYVGDVTDAAAVNAALQDFTQPGGGALDVLHNNAGLVEVGEFDQVPLEKHQRLIDVNLKGLVTVTHVALPYLKRSARAVIVNMSSASALYGHPEIATYAATKAGIYSLTEGWSIAFRKHGIRVADLLPIFVHTRMVHDYHHLYRNLDTQKVRLTPELVADRVWTAVHGQRLHYLIGTDTKIYASLLRWLPRRWAPPVVRKVLGYYE